MSNNSNENIPEKQLEKKSKRLDSIDEIEFVKTSVKNSKSSLSSDEYIKEKINSLQLSDENKKLVENLILNLDLEKPFVKNTEYATPLQKLGTEFVFSNTYIQEQINGLQLSNENKKAVENLILNLDLEKPFVKNTEYATPLQKLGTEFVFSNTYTQEQKDKLKISDETIKIVDNIIEKEKKPLNKNKI